MLSDLELLHKIQNNKDITSSYLGINPNLRKCCSTVFVGNKTFYTDGVNYYDSTGNKVTKQVIKKYGLY